MIEDFLLTDEEVGRAEGIVRKEFPRLPDGCEFVTYVQAPVPVEHNGVTQIVPRRAVFGIKVPNPRRPILPKLHRASWSLDDFRTMQRSHARYVDYPDPVVKAFREVAPKAIAWYETMRDITDPVEGDWSGKAGVLHGAD